MPVEQVRTLLVIALAVVSLLIWQAWRQDYGPKPTPPAPQSSTISGDAPAPAEAAAPDVPEAVTSDQPLTADAPEASDSAAVSGDFLSVRTDFYEAQMSLIGGTLTRVDLLKYPVSAEKPDVPFTLLNGKPPGIFIAQSGLVGGTGAPNHHQRFRSASQRYVMEDGQDTLVVPLIWEGSNGISVTKRYVFHRNRYKIDVSFEVTNNTQEDWQARMYGQFQRSVVEETRGIFRTYTYTGGVVSTVEPDKPYEKIDFSDMTKSNLNLSAQGGWIAMIQHYFAGAWIPDQNVESHYYTKALANERYVIGLLTPPKLVPSGSRDTFELGLYVGPKIQARMQGVAPNLERTVDFGFLWLIAEPLFWLLDWIHDFVGNWGWSIIILTLMIKLAFFHLSATSYKSMARMRKVQPRIVAIRERYGKDKQRMNQAMMELYKKEKINPLGGCFPILVQIPVFIALYWVLLESVELRQASFIFWLNDLSVHDPFFVLPVLMGATMLIQQKLNPPPPDPMQAKIMMALPFVFTFFFLFFPSGLVLYWFVNNLLSIAQQWVITRKIVGHA